MNREIIQFTDEAHWLSLRDQDLTSTDISALFGCSPYLTEYELWHRKTGQIAADFELNDRIKWGNRLESAIALGIAEDLGLIVEPLKVYIRLVGLRIGSSFDFKVVGIAEDFDGDETYRNLFREYGPGVMEVKNVDGLAFRRGWITGDDTEAPPHIEMQVQHQMLVAGLEWSIVAPLVGGNTPSPFYRLRDSSIGELIINRAGEFWKSVERGICPNPNYANDADTIGKIYRFDNGTTVDLSDNDRLYALCQAYKEAGAKEKEATTAKSAAKAEILTIIKGAKVALCSGAKISAGTTAGSTFTVNREASERLTVNCREYSVNLSQVPGSSYEVEREPFRSIRLGKV